MKIKFRQIIKSIEAKLDRCKKSSRFPMSTPPKNLPERGVYLFYERNKVLYVGRSNNIRRRFRNHLGKEHNQASFAFLLARHKTGLLKAAYTQKGSRGSLLKNRAFKKVFEGCRQRIRNMQVRVIEENDPTAQALLEIYAAFVTRAKHNSFDNH